MIISLLLTSALFACGDGSDSTGIVNNGIGGSSGGGSDNDNGGSEGSGESGPTVSFAAEIQGPTFTAICVGCHFTGNLQGLPDLSDGNSRQNLVNQDTTLTDGGGKRVVPGDSVNSILYQRISGIGLPAGEATMPFGDTQSLAENKDTAHLAQKIKTWIDEGALDN